MPCSSPECWEQEGDWLINTYKHRTHSLTFGSWELPSAPSLGDPFLVPRATESTRPLIPSLSDVSVKVEEEEFNDLVNKYLFIPTVCHALF